MNINECYIFIIYSLLYLEMNLHLVIISFSFFHLFYLFWIKIENLVYKISQRFLEECKTI